MTSIDRKADTRRERLCLYCPQMNPENGYCRRHGEYVNAFWSCRLFDDTEQELEPMPKVRNINRNRSRNDYYERGVSLALRTEKRCSRCGQVKPIDLFVRLNRSPDGHGCYCRECNAIRHREAKQKRLLKSLNQ